MSAAEAIVLLRRIFFAKGIFAGLQARWFSGNGAKAASGALLGACVCTEWSYAGVEECRRQASAARPSVSGLWKAGFLEE